MSTTHVPILFFGVYFDDEDEIEQFLLDYAKDPKFLPDEDESLKDSPLTVVAKNYLDEESGYAIGIRMEPGESEDRAKALWIKNFGTTDHGDFLAESHLDIWSY